MMEVRLIWKGRSVLYREKVLETVKNELRGGEKRIGVAYNEFINKYPNSMSYRTFKRMLTEMADREMISTRLYNGKDEYGNYGITTLVSVTS